jgi:hypothetical protein
MPVLCVVKPSAETIGVCAYCQQSHGYILQWHEVLHKALLCVNSQISLIFPPHSMFFMMHIYQQGQIVKTLILQVIARMERHYW